MSSEQTTKKPISVAYVRIENEPLPKMCSCCMKDLTGKDNIITSLGKYWCFECYKPVEYQGLQQKLSTAEQRIKKAVEIIRLFHK